MTFHGRKTRLAQMLGCWLVIIGLCVPSSLLHASSCTCKKETDKSLSANCCGSKIESVNCCSKQSSTSVAEQNSCCMNDSNAVSCCGGSSCSKSVIEDRCHCGHCECDGVVAFPESLPASLPPDSNGTEIEYLSLAATILCFDVRLNFCNNKLFLIDRHPNPRTSQQTCAMLSRFTC